MGIKSIKLRMDQLTKINSLSIAELRKILKDNDVKETSSDKEGLIYQATDVLLTNMAIQDFMECETPTIQKNINEYTIPDPDTILREQQDREYEECLEIDEKVMEEPIKETFDELSPSSLREKRLAYYQ
jgi:hypothetical protein